MSGKRAKGKSTHIRSDFCGPADGLYYHLYFLPLHSHPTDWTLGCGIEKEKERERGDILVKHFLSEMHQLSHKANTIERKKNEATKSAREDVECGNMCTHLHHFT